MTTRLPGFLIYRRNQFGKLIHTHRKREPEGTLEITQGNPLA